MRVKATSKVQGADRLTRRMVMGVAASIRMRHHKNIYDAGGNTVTAFIKRGISYKDIQLGVVEHKKTASVGLHGTERIRLTALPS